MAVDLSANASTMLWYLLWPLCEVLALYQLTQKTNGLC